MAKRGYKTKKDSDHPVKDPVRLMPARELFKANFAIVRRNFEATTVIVILPTLLLELSRLLTGDKLVVSNRMITASLLGFAAVCWLAAGAGALYVMQLKVAGGYYVRIRDCYRLGARYLPKLIGLGIIVSLTVLVSSLFLIIPGLIMFRRYFLAPLFLVDENIGIREAMQRSAAATKPASRAIYSVILIVSILGAVSYLLTKLWPAYGGALSVLMTYLYVYLPTLRYRELALGKSVQSLLDEQPATAKPLAVKE